ncbi:hypothetical protein Dsin_009000 [Dipteronia sinensis]|uniref:DUF4283 domain-containing protein n=1 Tax=Dipteronia sinensis TaxID=43782 RepID=A0AAE0AQF1_9ROSI|nr:hypothetical protein Dsin_009000 [Dipteronia sinensis]
MKVVQTEYPLSSNSTSLLTMEIGSVLPTPPPPPIEVADEGCKAWKNCVVGYFIEKQLSFSLVNNIAMKILGNCGLLEVLANEKGFYFFRFSDDDSCSKVLEAGPWLFAERMIILKKWHSRLVLTKESYSEVPVWVKFFNIPNEYWTEKGLSYVASAVGKPLYADSLTETMKRILYSRISVEIDATSKLIDSFDLLIGEGNEHNNGERVEILVEYQWKPKICLECKSFGHNAAACPSLKHVEGISDENRGSKMKQEWVKVNRGISSLPLSILRSEVHTIASNSKEEVVDTSNKFVAFIKEEEEAYSNEDSPGIASSDISLWHSKINNIDRIPTVGLSSTSEASSHKKKKRNSKASKSSKIIHCHACLRDNNDTFRISFVYGSNDDRARRALWENICANLSAGTHWIVLGDFNVARGVHDTIEGSSRRSVAMDEFEDCLQATELDDLRFLGFFHT